MPIVFNPIFILIIIIIIAVVWVYWDTRRFIRLLRQLGSSDSGQREKALVRLDKMRKTNALLNRFINLVQDEDPDIRRGAAVALGYLGETVAMQPLQLLLKDKLLSVRAEAVTALGGIPTLRSAELLVEILEDQGGEPALRARAATALGDSCEPFVITPLLRALSDQEERVRHQAIQALAKSGAERARMLLLKMLAEDPPEQSLVAAKALEIMSWKPESIRERVFWALAKSKTHEETILTLSPAEIDFLLQLLEHDNPNVRLKVIHALGKIKESRAVEPLLAMPAHEDETIKAAVIIALGDIGDPQAVPPLLNLLNVQRKVLRLVIVVALGKISDPRTIPALAELLQDSDAEVRLQAAKGLTRQKWRPGHTSEQVHYQIAKRDWETVLSFGAYAVAPLLKLAQDQQHEVRKQNQATLKRIFAAIPVLFFGEGQPFGAQRKTVLCNPDFTELTLPMPALQNILIHTAIYDFHLVERFITYALNYIGQEHLKRRVEVHLHGAPEQLHPNLRNNLEHLCLRVSVRLYRGGAPKSGTPNER